MRLLVLVLVLAACKLPDVTFTKGDGGTNSVDGGSSANHCTMGLGFPSVPWQVIGPGLTSIDLGDIDGDGITDLVAAAGVANSYAIHVLLGTGNGGFRVGQTITLTTQPVAIALGKIDSDERLDLVTANANNTVSVLLYNATNAAFDAPKSFSAGISPIALAIADVNGDGLGDIVTANTGSNAVNVLLSHGVAAFDSPVSHNLPSPPTAIAFGKLDSGTSLDIAVSATGIADGPGEVYELLNGGGGVFGDAQPIAAVDKVPSGLAIADLDGDSHDDLVVSGRGDGEISLIYGKASGGFEPPVNRPLVGATSIAVGRLDSDDRLDLVATTTDGVFAMAGLGGRMFAAPVRTFAGATPGRVAIAPSQQGTSAPALVAAANLDDGSVTLWRARSDGTLIAPAVQSVGMVPTDAIVTSLRDHPAADAPLDIVVSGSADGTLSWLYDHGAKQTFPVDPDGPTQPGPLAAGDFDGDGHMDLAVTDSMNAKLHLLFGDGTGKIRDRLALDQPSSPRAIVAADVNNDHQIDLIVADRTAHMVLTLLNTHAMNPDPKPLPLDSDGEPVAIAAVDFTGDGKLDLAVADAATHQIRLFTGDGSGGFTAGTTLSLNGGTPTGVALAPLHPGGAVDLVVTVDATPPMLYVFRNQGAALFAALPERYPTGGAPQSPVIADVTHDQLPDVLYTSRNGSTVSVLAGKSDGSLAAEVDYGVGSTPGNFAVGDVTGDGVVDLVVPNGEAQLTVLAATCL